MCAVLAAVLGAIGCGNPGPPSPPSLLLPQPVGDLSAKRIGDTVVLRWTLPERSTDRIALRGSLRASLCRASDNGPCEPTGTVSAAPGTPAQYRDVLPPALRMGAPRLLTYRVRLENRRGADAGPSNPAFTAAGSAPPVLREAVATAAAGGVAIRWSLASTPPAPSGRVFADLQRQEVTAAPSEPVTLNSALDRSWLPLAAMDTGALTGRRYTYRVALVERFSLAGHPIEVAGESASAAELLVRDTFPPAVPVGLEAAANVQGGKIDLSWTPNADADLLGYFIYRRDLHGGAAVRVSGAKPILAPGWSDRSAPRGVRYGYSVSAVDASGNESARSRESAEMLP